MLRTARGMLLAIVALPALVFWLGRGDADLERSVPAEAGETLTVELSLDGPFAWDRGTLEISGHDADEVRIEVAGTGWGQYALDLNIDDTPDGVRVKGEVDGFLHWAFGGPTFDVHIYAPHGVALDLRAANVPVKLEDLTGGVIARVDTEDISLERAEGDVRIRSTEGNVRVEDVNGNAVLASERGSIHVEAIEGAVDARTEREPIHISAVDGPVAAVSERGRVHVERVRGEVRAASERGRIQIEDVRGGVQVNAERSRIQIEELDGPVLAYSEHGRIEVEFVGAPAGSIVTGHGAIHVDVRERAGFDLEASASRGAVHVDPDLAFVSTDTASNVADELALLPGIPETGHPSSDDLPQLHAIPKPRALPEPQALPKPQALAEPNDASRWTWREQDWWDRHGAGDWLDEHGFGDWPEWPEWNGAQDPRSWSRPRARGRRSRQEIGRVNGGGALLKLESNRGSIHVED